jgi:hypothetical protein
VKELKQRFAERGMSVKGLVEKSELVAALERGPSPGTAAAAATAAAPASRRRCATVDACFEPGADRTCTVCMEELGPGDVVTQLPGCGHWFHLGKSPPKPEEAAAAAVAAAAAASPGGDACPGVLTWLAKKCTCPNCKNELPRESAVATASAAAAGVGGIPAWATAAAAGAAAAAAGAAFARSAAQRHAPATTRADTAPAAEEPGEDSDGMPPLGSPLGAPTGDDSDGPPPLMSESSSPDEDEAPPPLEAIEGSARTGGRRRAVPASEVGPGAPTVASATSPSASLPSSSSPRTRSRTRAPSPSPSPSPDAKRSRKR